MCIYFCSRDSNAIHIGHHKMVFKLLEASFNGDTILATSITAVIVLILALFLRYKVTYTEVPGIVQVIWEMLTIHMSDQIELAIGMQIAPFVLPLVITLFIFILISNWLTVLPLQYGIANSVSELYEAPASDINFVLALATFVFIYYNFSGICCRGLIGYITKVLKGHVTILLPINLVEEIAKPISLALRLFGNIFAGGILITLIAKFPWYIQWAPSAIWKIFDLFVGLIQAFIFSLLTILYFKQAMEIDHAAESNHKFV